jgi:hypothetical protein
LSTNCNAITVCTPETRVRCIRTAKDILGAPFINYSTARADSIVSGATLALQRMVQPIIPYTEAQVSN